MAVFTGLGSAASPSITFSADTNTGIFSPGADQVAISTNSTGRLFVASDGRVGINTAAPNTTLHVSGGAELGALNTTVLPTSSVDGGAFFSWNRGGGSAETNICNLFDNAQLSFEFLQKTGASTASVLSSIGTTNHIFYIANTERMRLDSTGRLGLGTSSPESLLNLSSAAPTTVSGVTLLQRINSNSGNVTFLDFLSRRHTAGSDWEGVSLRLQHQVDLSAMGYLEFNPTNNSQSVAIGHGDTARLTVTSGGNVGIGTTSPGALLDVSAGSTSLACRIQGTSSPYLSVLDSVTNIQALIAADNTGAGIFGTISDHPCAFRTNNTERARIDSAGRLLVGTSSSFAVGTIEAAVQVQGQGNLLSLYRNGGANSDAPAVINLGRSRGTANGSVTAVANGDRLGSLVFNGANGTDASNFAAWIVCEVDGTPGVDDMPGRLVFSVTADGASSPTEAMRIKNTRIINIANTPVYADNAAAKTGGLVDGDVYRTSTGDLKIVYT